MTAKYLGKRSVKDSSGYLMYKLDPCIMITMHKVEVSKFEEMMKYIQGNYFDWKYYFIGDGIDNTYTAYVDVDNREDGDDFLDCYNEAKKLVR